MKEETVFKVGDKVYDHLRGWGVVIENNKLGTEFPIIVQFKTEQHSYTLDGKDFDDDLHPILSFTEYDFVNGGFSQVRPCRFEKYEPVMCSSTEGVWYPHLHKGEYDNEVFFGAPNDAVILKYDNILTLDEWKEKFNIK